MRPRPAGWLIWAAVVLAFIGLGLSRQQYLAVDRALNRGQSNSRLDRVRDYLTDDGDVRRYFAYAQAERGHAYPSYYVRSEEDWRKAFATLEPYDPEAWPTVFPPRPLVPYRDYLVEYPPGFFLAALPPTWLTSEADAYVLWFAAYMALALTVALWLVTWSIRQLDARSLSSDTVAAWAALAVLLLGTVTIHRYDAVVALALAVGLAGLAGRRPLVQGAGLGIAIALKATPVLVMPIVILHALRERRWRDLLLLCLALPASAALVSLPWLLSAGHHVVAVFRYHADRPLQIESSWAALIGLLHALGLGTARVELTYGSLNVVSPAARILAPLANVVTAVGVLVVYAVSWRRLAAGSAAERGRVALEASAAALAVFVACGKVASPQYLVWILPLGIGLSLTAPRRVSLVLLLLSMALVQAVYPLSYGSLQKLEAVPCLLVLARNSTLLAWGVLLLRRGGVADPYRSSRSGIGWSR
ncbi:MAG TPA: glycosyltransferase family 87 protein [Vicinamibacteria bacterium]|nr:glycosyltransferase family 87 protein [Vicinamibacteria bacterium]